MPPQNTAQYLLKLERDMSSGFLHLLVLHHVDRDQPIHGYGLIKAMEASMGGRSQWKEGTVYPLLGTLEKEGLVRSRWGKGGTGPRRKYYEMMPAGSEILDLALLKYRRLRGELDRLFEDKVDP